MMRRLAIIVLALMSARSASAETPDEPERVELEKLRQQVAGEVQLSASNLIDEMIYGWTQKPVFEQPTDVVLAGVTVPVGLGTGLQALLENHLNAVLVKNPATHMVLTHCPECTAVVVHSGPKGTIVSRGVDDPEVMARVRRDTATRYALFVDIEAEGTWLVLRARLTQLNSNLAVVWARTISSAGSAPSMLRQADAIKSVEDAREELYRAAHDRWPLTIPLRLSIRVYNDGSTAPVIPPPFAWIQGGVELALGQARAWNASFLLGYGYVPSSFDGLMVQGRVSRLLTGASRSYTHPDVYAFVGSSIFAVWGPSAAIFQRNQLTTEDILALADGNNGPPQFVATLHAGLELKVGNRIGISFFGEALPAHWSSDNLATYLEIFHSIGFEVGVWF